MGIITDITTYTATVSFDPITRSSNLVILQGATPLAAYTYTNGAVYSPARTESLTMPVSGLNFTLTEVDKWIQACVEKLPQTPFDPATTTATHSVSPTAVSVTATVRGHTFSADWTEAAGVTMAPRAAIDQPLEAFTDITNILKRFRDNIPGAVIPSAGPLTNTQLRAAPVEVEGDVQALGSLTNTELRASAVPVSLATAPSTPVTGTFWQAVQPVSGTVTATGPLTDTQLRATAVPVSLASTTVTNFPATQPVSAAALPLPSGASTETTLAAIRAKTDLLTFTGSDLRITGGAGGGGGDGAILDGTTPTQKAQVDTSGRLAVRSKADPTWYIWVPAQACAQNKLFLSFLNNAGSGQVIKLRKLFLLNAALAAVTGVGLQFDVKRISAITGGTAVTPSIMDTADTALSSVTCVHTATSATEGVILYSWFTNNDEIGLTGGFPMAMIQAVSSTQPEGMEIKELTLNAGEGFCVKQITNSAVGSYGVLAVITRGA